MWYTTSPKVTVLHIYRMVVPRTTSHREPLLQNDVPAEMRHWNFEKLGMTKFKIMYGLCEGLVRWLACSSSTRSGPSYLEIWVKDNNGIQVILIQKEPDRNSALCGWNNGHLLNTVYLGLVHKYRVPPEQVIAQFKTEVFKSSKTYMKKKCTTYNH